MGLISFLSLQALWSPLALRCSVSSDSKYLGTRSLLNMSVGGYFSHRLTVLCGALQNAAGNLPSYFCRNICRNLSAFRTENCRQGARRKYRSVSMFKPHSLPKKYHSLLMAILCRKINCPTCFHLLAFIIHQKYRCDLSKNGFIQSR